MGNLLIILVYNIYISIAHDCLELIKKKKKVKINENENKFKLTGIKWVREN